ncbi:hypothetical protein [Nocardioides sp. KR10-350]|uniref:hypothetical protein n=1 Tax=Nocardioides cheoyonin TaxID=3156615 RepID=UPI0032B43878
MNKLALAAVPVAAATAVGLALTGGAADAGHPAARYHTVSGHLIESSSWGWPTGYVSLDDDYSVAGKKIASDVTTCRGSSPTATTAACEAAIAFKGGLVVVGWTATTKPGPIRATVLGGTGTYRHVRGFAVIREGDNSGDGPSTADWTMRIAY